MQSTEGKITLRWYEPLREPPSGRLFSPIDYTYVIFKIINMAEDI